MALVPKLPALSDTNSKLNSKPNENKNVIFPYCTTNLNKKVKYEIELNEPRPSINFKHLEWLIDMEKSAKNKDEAHETFMESYRKIFNTDSSLKPALSQNYLKPIKKSSDGSKLELKVSETKSGEDDLAKSHEISMHLDKLHRKKVQIEDPELKQLEALKKLRRLVKKFPFERNETENREIFQILITLEEFCELFSEKILENKNILQRLCSYASLETVSSKATPVFGNFGFYLILKGGVQPLSIPHLNRHHMRLRVSTPEPDQPQILGAGKCFGTITELKERDMTTRMFRVMTLEDKCEFLKISIESFTKIIKKVEDEEKNAKLLAIKSCQSYSSWPKHTLEELMDIFEWRHFSANTILTSEGYRCPFIGFINKGTCHVLRKVDVPYLNKKTGVKEKRMKQVVVGKLNELESFGEISVILREPMTCSIVTETPCKIGIVAYDRITKLDNITLRLLLQTNNRTFADLTQDEIYKKFIEQEKKKEWKQFKNLVIKNVVDKYGIVQESLKNNASIEQLKKQEQQSS